YCEFVTAVFNALGKGSSLSRAWPFGLILLAGMILPGKQDVLVVALQVPVSVGSLIYTAAVPFIDWEKSPLRSAAVGVVRLTMLCGRRSLIVSTEAKKNSLLLERLVRKGI